MWIWITFILISIIVVNFVAYKVMNHSVWEKLEQEIRDTDNPGEIVGRIRDCFIVIFMMMMAGVLVFILQSIQNAFNFSLSIKALGLNYVSPTAQIISLLIICLSGLYWMKKTPKGIKNTQ